MGEVEKSLGKLAEEINHEHQAFRRAFNATFRSALRAGDLLNEAKAKAGHGNWETWVEENCEFSMRTAQVYMRIANNREVVEEHLRSADSAGLSIEGVLQELATPKQIAASERPEGIPPGEWAIVKDATESVFVVAPDLGRLAAMSEEKRRGFVEQMAWMAMLEQGREYSFLRDQVHWSTGPTEDLAVVEPELLTQLHEETDKLRWWVEQSEWIESIVRACDWPPGGGMPDEAFDEEKSHLPLSRLYNRDKGLPSPRERIREFCGPVV
jgi:hypothetical protein